MSGVRGSGKDEVRPWREEAQRREGGRIRGYEWADWIFGGGAPAAAG